jgi:aminopeptidase-like protein
LSRRIAITVAIAVLLIGQGLAQEAAVDLAGMELVRSRLESGGVGQRQRQAAIRNLFSDEGCVVEEQRVDKDSANVICMLPGETSSTIVVGGHFDFANWGKGIVDDWSGTSLLPSLFRALKSRPRRHTYVFVAFAGEERGLVGSAQYVSHLSKQQKELIRAFVNLECLGLSPMKVWVSRSTPALVSRLTDVARSLGIPLQGVNVDKVGDDDTHSFLSARIPVISIHSVTQETLPVLHTGRDRVEAINFNDYYSAYQLTAFYLAYLDAKME